MKQTFLVTTAALGSLNMFKLIDRDRGQIDHYTDGRPQVPFPCALVKVSMPKRKNIAIGGKQQRNVVIQVRICFERLYDGSNLNDVNRAKALEYFDKAEVVDELLHNFEHEHFVTPWECTAELDEERADFDIMRFTYTTAIYK